MSLPIAIIVAHGSPSVPVPLDLWIKVLALKVAALTPNFEVGGATLGMPKSLEKELAKARPGEPILLYPFFMSDGWFTKVEMMRRAKAATTNPLISMPAFGLDERMADLCVRSVTHEIASRGEAASRSVLVLAAHGSMKNPASANAARAIQSNIIAAGAFRDVRLGLVEEPPTIAEAAAGLTGQPSVCLPLFATRGGHVTGDIPDQLAEAQFDGHVMDPIGECAEVDAIISRALARHALAPAS